LLRLQSTAIFAVPTKRDPTVLMIAVDCKFVRVCHRPTDSGNNSNSTAGHIRGRQRSRHQAARARGRQSQRRTPDARRTEATEPRREREQHASSRREASAVAIFAAQGAGLYWPRAPSALSTIPSIFVRGCRTAIGTSRRCSARLVWLGPSQTFGCEIMYRPFGRNSCRTLRRLS
jgi:hypothetical protein